MSSPPFEAGTDRPRPRRIPRRAVRWILGVVGGVFVAAFAGFGIYTQVGVMSAEPGPVADVRADPTITVDESDAAIILRPTSGAADVGLVYIPGAKVDPWAYASKMSGVAADDGVTVVITKPWLNLPIADLRSLSTFTDLVPSVDTWIVGGHSLGGVRACMLAPDADALALFASYCASDVSEPALPVLSIAGAEDGLSTPTDIAGARSQLPSDAEMVEIAGAAHSSFGDYGDQAGDGIPTISDGAMTTHLTSLVGSLAASLVGR